jgi:dolichol-phosphate mannosyltransferase
VKALVVLPSYNERENIVELIDAVLAEPYGFDVLVVDDSSPDGTGDHLETVRAARRDWNDRVSILHRAGKGGRGSAVRDGITHGLMMPNHYHIFVEMDCDFSHPPRELGAGLKLLEDADVVIGSRYPDGEIIDWPMTRRVFSRLANLLARTLLKWRIPDYTNGFRFYSRQAAQTLASQEQKHTGFIYLSESLAQLMKAGFKVDTFPTVFRNRTRGKSNTTMAEVASSFAGLFAIAWDFRLRRSRQP